MRVLHTAQGSLKMLGEHPGLDLVNSIDSERGRRIDYLEDGEQLLAWAVAAGLIETGMAAELNRRFRKDPSLAQPLLADVLRLRAYLGELMTGHRNEALAELINRLLPSPLLRADHRLYVPEDAPEHTLLAQLALSASDLILSGRLDQVRQCEAPGCDWYFIDQTGRRRWCIMEGCGNAAKARRHRARAKGGP